MLHPFTHGLHKKKRDKPVLHQYSALGHGLIRPCGPREHLPSNIRLLKKTCSMIGWKLDSRLRECFQRTGGFKEHDDIQGPMTKFLCQGVPVGKNISSEP